MGNVADKLLILLLRLQLLFRGFLQPAAHILKICAELSDLILSAGRHLKIQIAIGNLFGRHLQMMDGRHDAFINPCRQNHTGKNQNQRQDHDHIHHQRLHLRNHAAYGSDNERRALRLIGIPEIQLPHKSLQISSNIDSHILLLIRIMGSVFRQAFQKICLVPVISYIGEDVSFTHHQK